MSPPPHWMRAVLASVLSCRLAGGLQADTNTNRNLSSVEGQERMRRALERLGQGYSGSTRGERRGRCKALRRSLGGVKCRRLRSAILSLARLV